MIRNQFPSINFFFNAWKELQRELFLQNMDFHVDYLLDANTCLHLGCNHLIHVEKSSVALAPNYRANGKCGKAVNAQPDNMTFQHCCLCWITFQKHCEASGNLLNAKNEIITMPAWDGLFRFCFKKPCEISLKLFHLINFAPLWILIEQHIPKTLHQENWTLKLLFDAIERNSLCTGRLLRTQNIRPDRFACNWIRIDVEEKSVLGSMLKNAANISVDFFWLKSFFISDLFNYHCSVCRLGTKMKFQVFSGN